MVISIEWRFDNNDKRADRYLYPIEFAEQRDLSCLELPLRLNGTVSRERFGPDFSTGLAEYRRLPSSGDLSLTRRNAFVEQPPIADQAFMPNMPKSVSGYKVDLIASHSPSPGPSSPAAPTLLSSSSPSVTPSSGLAAIVTTTTTTHSQHPRRLPRSSLPALKRPSPLALPTTRSRPRARQAESGSSQITPPSPATPYHSLKRSDHYDWSPILLLTPPNSSRSSEHRSSSSPHGEADSSTRFPIPSFYFDDCRCERSRIWPTSPTLSTCRAKKALQLQPTPLPLLTSAKEQNTFDRSAPTRLSSEMVSHDASQFPSRTPPESAHGGMSPTTHNIDSPVATSEESHKMKPPSKPRALTLGSIDRPVLPPLVGGTSPSHLGPIRSFASAFRKGTEYRNNPYFIFNPARRSNDYFTLPVSPSRIDTRASSPFQTPTSSIRSTSSEFEIEDIRILSRATSHASFVPPSSRSELSSLVVRPILPCLGTAIDSEGSTEERSRSSRLPSSHLATPDNALGLFLEPTPFPSEPLHLELGSIQPRRLSPGTEADFYLGQAGGSVNFLDTSGRNKQHVLTRSPAFLSDASSRVPSLSPNSDDSLHKLSLARRHNLNERGAETSLVLPSLKTDYDAGAHPLADVSAARVQTKSGLPQDSFIYKMPVLRAMSPLAESSSDSEDPVSDEPLAVPSSLTSPSVLASSTEKEPRELSVPQEGRTGEIFVTMKSLLPLTSKQSRSSTIDQLFCKLESTSHKCFSVVDGKWACYRRNYLKVDVSFHFEDEQGRSRDTVEGDLICQAGSPSAFVVDRFAVHLTAHVINSDGRIQKGRQGFVPLIQFGPARERGPREAVQPVELRSGGGISKDASVNEQTATRSGSVAAFRRVQIRSATMNNGQRGAASQQFYALKLTLLAYPKQSALTASAGVEVASLTSHPITVRGRSKVHYAVAPTATANSEARTVVNAVSHINAAMPTTTRIRTKHKGYTRSGGESAEHRRSRRLQYDDAPIDVNEVADMMQDADDEGEARDLPYPYVASRRISKVMDIRSII
ncbi:DNA-binding [Pseudozyma hubeiensis SY62]|uniref:DNA-binding n=1 Tax=Pseudozyma hubeiensis (strain SY62) TaxID=1305764 RepID=R9P5P6_PSEHS|nr:DNA-binding [Pseudozyma hubeiensis SY62]GAC93410.1 DNA-binding [Pseudozyma hubeiensis SY62]